MNFIIWSGLNENLLITIAVLFTFFYSRIKIWAGLLD